MTFEISSKSVSCLFNLLSSPRFILIQFELFRSQFLFKALYSSQKYDVHMLSQIGKLLHISCGNLLLADLRSKSAYGIVICNPHLAQLRVVPRSQWSEGSPKL